MQDFCDHVKECMEGVPATTWDPESSYLSDYGVRGELNDHLDDITDYARHPAAEYEEVRVFLQGRNIELPPVSVYADEFLENDGEIIIPLVSTIEVPNLLFIYFAFTMNEVTDGEFEVFSEIVTQNELEEILSDEDVETV